MINPSSWIPSRRASADLMGISKALKLNLNGHVAQTLPDGTRLLEGLNGTFEDFPATYDSTLIEASLPPIIIDFFEWFYIPAQQVPSGPIVTEDKRLRLVIEANYNFDDAYSAEPAKCTLGTPEFEWVDSTIGIPATSAAVSPGTPFDYYFYLMRVQSGLITERADAILFTRWPGA